MAYTVTWLVDKRVIYFHPTGIISADQLKAANEQIRMMTDEGIQFVHVIADATELEKITAGLSDLVAMFRGMTPSSNLGWSVYVSPRMMGRFFANVTAQRTTARHREFATLQEAITFLQTMDETLPQIPQPITKDYSD